MRGARAAEVARVFGWLGATAFGGPAAHVGLMHRELVERRKRVDESTFKPGTNPLPRSARALEARSLENLGGDAHVRP